MPIGINTTFPLSVFTTPLLPISVRFTPFPGSQDSQQWACAGISEIHEAFVNKLVEEKEKIALVVASSTSYLLKLGHTALA